MRLLSPIDEATDILTRDYVNTSAVGYVDGGSTAGTARPTGFTVVLWRASGVVNFTNAVTGDLRIRPS